MKNIIRRKTFIFSALYLTLPFITASNCAAETAKKDLGHAAQSEIKPVPKDFEPDYIIVGSGAGGGVLAARLAEDKNNKVLLIEAGIDNSKEKNILQISTAYLLWGFPKAVVADSSGLAFNTIPQNGKIYAYPRGNGLGGSVNHHAAVDGRGHPAIYDGWSQILGDPDWSSANTDKQFMKMENYGIPTAKKEIHGQNGWLHVKQNKPLREEFDRDFVSTIKEKFNVPWRDDFYDNPADNSGIGMTDFQAQNDGTRSYVVNDLLLPRYKENNEKGWNNLQIATNKLATKVIFEGNEAVGIEVIDAAGAYQADRRYNPLSKNAPKITYKAKKEVILCGGAINTPQILLLSGVGPKEELEKLGIKVVDNLPGVGKHLLDHIEVVNVYEAKNLPNKAWIAQATRMAEKDPSWSKLADPTTLTEVDIPMMWEWYSDYDARDARVPDLHIHYGHGYWRDFNIDPAQYADKDPLKAGFLGKLAETDNPKKPIAYVYLLTEAIKTSSDKGSITLAGTDPTQAPIIDLKLYETDEDVSRLAKGIMMQREVMKQPSLAKYELVEVLPGAEYKTLEQVKDYIRKYSAFGHHMGGTAKMGTDKDPMAVTDSNGLVRGVKKLRICDASLFPTEPGYNTSRPTYMIGEVIADKIKAGK